MGRKLWFIGNGERPINVFPSQRAAQYELDAIQRDEPDDHTEYDLYGVEVDDLEDYPEELGLAEEEGLL